MNLNVLKKLSALALALAMTASLAACGGSDDAAGDDGDDEAVKYLIGISQYGQHGSLDNCREGFLQGLEQAGWWRAPTLRGGLPERQLRRQPDRPDRPDLLRRERGPDGGHRHQRRRGLLHAAEDKDIPVIFTAITDPVGAHLDEGNITGTSDALPVAGQLELIGPCSRRLRPSASTTPPARPTPSTPSASMRSWRQTTASPSTRWASPPSPRSPRRWTPSSPTGWTACPT